VIAERTLPPATLASDKEADRAFRITAVRVVAVCIAVAR
jgi:hypothetical protein